MTAEMRLPWMRQATLMWPAERRRRTFRSRRARFKKRLEAQRWPGCVCLELASSGGSLTYSTYLGGSSVDYALGIALATDGSGDTFVVGLTGSTNFPGTTTSPIQHTLISTSDGFVTKLNASGSALLLFDLPGRQFGRLRILGRSRFFE